MERREIKLLPHSDEAERGVIGSFIMEPERVSQLCKTYNVTKTTFFTPSHSVLFEALCNMLRDEKPIDILTIGEYLKSSGVLDATGGYIAIEDIIDSTPTAAHAEYYMEILADKQKRRELIQASLNAIDKCRDDSDSTPLSIGTHLASSVEGITSVEQAERSNDEITIHHREAMNGNPNSIPLPFKKLNMRTGGVRKKMVTVFTGQSKAGKSMFKGFWHRFLGEKGIPMLDFCFEDKWEIAKARAASIGRYSVSRLDAGGYYYKEGDEYKWCKTTEKELDVEQKMLEHLDTLPMYWYDKKMCYEEMNEKIGWYATRHKIQGVFIDGAKDMKRGKGQHNDCGFEEEVSQAFTEMASRWNVAMIPIHHLTKSDPDTLITVTDIRGSGNIVSDSRSVYALQSNGLERYADCGYHPISFDEDGYQTSRVLECLANNHGKQGKVWLDSDLDYCNFYENK